MAIDDLLDEHEQSERVRNWLQRNGIGLIGGFALGLGLIAGWQWWQKRTENRYLQAGETFQSVARNLQTKNLKQAQAEAAKLQGGAYAALAALDMAKAQLDAGQRDAAIATLRAAAGTDDPGLSAVIAQRLARLLIDAGKGEEALKLIGDATDAASLEANGDAQLALGRREQARAAYSKALTKLDVAAPNRRLLELKLSEAGGTPIKSDRPAPESRS